MEMFSQFFDGQYLSQVASVIVPFVGVGLFLPVFPWLVGQAFHVARMVFR